MHGEAYRHYGHSGAGARGGFLDASSLTSPSTPLSSMPNITATGTTSSPTKNPNERPHRRTSKQHQQHQQQLTQQREEQLQQALQHAEPTPAEVSAVASAAYVRSLMELIDQHGHDVQQVRQRIDELQVRREAFYSALSQDVVTREAAMQDLRNERSDLTLQVQEERERSTRLLHENTVLHTQQAEQNDQLAKLAELCHARGKRLRAYYHQLRKDTASSSPHSGRRNAEQESNSPMEWSGGAKEPCGPPALSAAAALASPQPSPSNLFPASLSLRRASGVLSTASPSRNVVGSAATAGLSSSLDDIADDPEVAAILRAPYKVLISNASPSDLSSSSPTPQDERWSFTATANAAATAQLLALNEEVNMLKQQLEEQRSTYEQERGCRTREDNEAHRQHSEQLATYRTTVHQFEALHEECLRDLVQYRHHTEKQLRDTRGQVEWLRAALQNAVQLAEEDRRQKHNDVYVTEQRMSKQYYPKVQSLHAEITTYRQRAAAQSRTYQEALHEKEAQIEELQQKLKAETAQRRRVEERYKLEMDGVQSELALMRQSLRQMERRVYYRNVREAASEEAEVELERYYY